SPTSRTSTSLLPARTKLRPSRPCSARSSHGARRLRPCGKLGKPHSGDSAADPHENNQNKGERPRRRTWVSGPPKTAPGADRLPEGDVRGHPLCPASGQD